MSAKKILVYAGVLAAIVATITGVAGLEARTPNVNPIGALALAVSALAFFRGSELVKS